MRFSRNDGYTLMEILMSSGILVLLGGGLVALLSQAVFLWHRAETIGQVYDQARAVLDIVASDLRSTVIRSHIADRDVGIRFLCDLDPQGRQRLRFVRTIPGEPQHPILRQGGRYLALRTPAVYDGTTDAREARDGLLGAPGGVMEVLYARDPRPGERWLWRGFRSPIGGNDSLFHDRNLKLSSPPVAEKVATKKTLRRKKKSGKRSGAKAADDGGGTGTVADPYEGVAFRGVARPVTDRILFLGYRFWGPTTNTWDPGFAPQSEIEPGKKSGALRQWDSTRAVLDLEAGAGEFTFRRRPMSLNDPSDDLFPEMVEVVLVLRLGDSPLGARLSENVATKTRSFLISHEHSLAEDPRHRYLLLDDEWIAVTDISGRIVSVARDGRGARGTEATNHPQGTPVEFGLTFRRVVEIPGHRSVRGDSVSKEPRGYRRGRRRR